MPASITLVHSGLDLVLANELTIEELTGSRHGHLTLRSSGLPRTGAAWGVHQNAPTTWYPGNPEASQQVLGGQLIPSEWEGSWRRTLLGRVPQHWNQTGKGGLGNPIVQPQTLVEIFESICLAGMRLRVKWRSIVREGRMVDFSAKHGRATNVEWTAKFEWVNRGRNADRRVLGVRSGNVDGLLRGGAEQGEWAANMEPTRLLVSQRPATLPKGCPTMTLGQIGGLLAAPGKMLSSFCRQCRTFANKVRQVADLVKQARNLPYSLANTVLNETENTLAICNNFADSMSRVSPEQLALRRNCADVARNASYFGSAVRQSQVMAGELARIREAVRKISADAHGGPATASGAGPLSRDILGVHVVKQGETLVSISTAYYGTPDHAYDIAVSNHIAYPCAPDPNDHTIGGKRTIIIPVLSRGGT